MIVATAAEKLASHYAKSILAKTMKIKEPRKSKRQPISQNKNN